MYTITNQKDGQKTSLMNFTLFPHEDSLGLFFCHFGYDKETKSVEFIYVAVCVKLTYIMTVLHNGIPLYMLQTKFQGNRVRISCFIPTFKQCIKLIIQAPVAP